MLQFLVKIYFIAISGTGVGNLAILLKNQGHDVRGSEHSAKTFYPPISDSIKEHGIPVTLKFDPAEITPDVDLVIMGGAAFIHDPNNPQVAKAKELGLKLITYARGIGEFVAKENNIEVVGNHGKTTTTTLIAHSLRACKVDVSYFVGGRAKGFEQPIHSGNDPWSVCEGDEHPSLGQEPGGKFLYHKPKHVVFTSADWDHKNVYKTEEDYVETFRELFRIIPNDGLVTACADGKNVLSILEESNNNKVVLYTISRYKTELQPTPETKTAVGKEVLTMIQNIAHSYPKTYEKLEKLYFVDDVQYAEKETKFHVSYWLKEEGRLHELGYFSTPLIGPIGVENSLAAISVLTSLDFSLEGIQKGIATFSGVQRKLEVLQTEPYVIINDHAHSPIKIESSLRAIRTRYPTQQLLVLFHVAQGGLKERTTFNQLKTVFNLADWVLIPRVTPDRVAEDKIFGKDYVELLQHGAADRLSAEHVVYTPLPQQMKDLLQKELKPGDVVVIMSSGDATELLEAAKSVAP